MANTSKNGNLEYNDSQRIIVKNEPKLEAKLSAFPYQYDAVKAICDLDYAAIFFEQGLGKSKIAIDLMLYWLGKKAVDTILYVAKKNLIPNCEREFLMHSFIKPRILSQNRQLNFYVYNTPSRLVLTHYEVLKSESSRLKLFCNARNVAVIFDESTKIKNPYSSVTQSAFDLAPLFKKRVIMTGTPVANRPYDIWAQIYFLDQGKSLGDNYEEFKRSSDLSNTLYKREETQKEFGIFLSSIFTKISKFTVRQTKDSGIIQLPDKEIWTISTDWERVQLDLYNQVKNEARAVILKDGIPTEDNAGPVLKRLLRLVQIASNPGLIDEGYNRSPGKYEYLLDIVSNICSKNEKCIVWTSFIENADWLYKGLKNFGSRRIHGNISIADRYKALESFLSDGAVHVLVATPGAAKEGLTLTAANHVIYYDRTFSLDDYLQSQDRIHRISQTRKCYVYNLIMKDSIDEWVDILLQAKHLAARLSEGDISLDYYNSQISYEFGEIIKSILSINSV